MEETRKSKQGSFIGALLGLVLLISGTVVALNIVDSPPNRDNKASTSQTQDKKETNNKYLVSFTAAKNQTVLAQLKDKADVTLVEDPQYGAYVDSINDVKGGTDGKYWTYYVDGKMASVGAAEYKTKGGEKVEWKFE